MRYESATSFVNQVLDEAQQEPQTDAQAARAEAFPLSDPIEGASVGVTREGTRKDGFQVAVFASDPAAASALSEKASGECVVRMVPPVFQSAATASYFQQTLEVKHSGARTAPSNVNYVGSMSRIFEWMGRLKVVSNNHVFANVNRFQAGRTLMQGRDVLGTLETVVPISFASPNLTDIAVGDVWDDVEVWPNYCEGAKEEILSIEDPTPDDLNQEHFNDGQTLGSNKGVCIAIGVASTRVGYGQDGVALFNRTAYYSKPGAGSFSIGGHSGSEIVRGASMASKSLLFAGGQTSDGREDLTIAAYMLSSIREAGYEPEMAS